MLCFVGQAKLLLGTAEPLSLSLKPDTALLHFEDLTKQEVKSKFPMTPA